MPTDDSQHFENKNIYFYQNNRKDFFIAYHESCRGKVWILYVLAL